MAKKNNKKYDATKFFELYSRDRIKSMSQTEIQKEIRYFDKVIKAREQWLKGSEYEDLANLRTSEKLYGQYKRNPSAFDPVKELQAKAEYVYSNISLSGLREEQREMQTLAREIFKDYRGLYDIGTGFSEFMGALRYSGLLEKFGSDVAQRIYEDAVEEGGLKPGMILANYERYYKMYK